MKLIWNYDEFLCFNYLSADKNVTVERGNLVESGEKCLDILTEIVIFLIF